MTVFRRTEFQISPRPLLFLFNAEADDSFCAVLNLTDEPNIVCHVIAVEDAADQMRVHGVDHAQGYCGFVTVDRTYSEIDIYLSVSQKQFDFLAAIILSHGDRPYTVSVRLIPSSDFEIVAHRRVHKIEENPLISLSLTDA